MTAVPSLPVTTIEAAFGYSPFDTSPTWTDISAYVQKFSTQRGRQHELSTTEAGRCTLTLNNRDARFNTWNTSSPYTGGLLPLTPIKITATWANQPFPVFYGYVDSWVPQWADPLSNEMTIQATDMLGLLNVWSMNSSAYQDAVLADNPVMFWQCSDTQGSSTLQDSSGNNQTIALQPAPSGGSEQYSLGNSGALPCSADTSLQLAAQSSSVWSGFAPFVLTELVGNTTGFSFEMWFQVPSGSAVPGTDVALMGFDFPNSTSTTPSWYASVQYTAGVGLYVDVGGVTIGNQDSGSNEVFADDGSWHYLCVSIVPDGTQTTVSWQFDYRFGSSTSTYQLFPSTFRQGLAAIGAGGGATEPQNTQPLNVQEVAVYNAALTFTQSGNHRAAAYPALTAQQSTDENISDGAALLGIPAGFLQIHTGGVACQPAAATSSQTSQGSTASTEQVQSLVTQNALSFMQQFETTEAGLLFVTASGVLTFYPHTYATSYELFSVSTWTVEDAPGSADGWFQTALGIGLDDEDLWNEVLGAAQQNEELGISGVYQAYEDPASQAMYGKRTYPEQSGLLMISDAAVLAFVQWLGNQYHEPLHRVRKISMTSAAAQAFPQQLRTMLGPDLWDMLDVTFNGLNGGTAFTQLERIEGISHQVDFQKGTWVTSFDLCPAFAPDVLILNSVTNGQLNAGNYLGW